MFTCMLGLARAPSSSSLNLPWGGAASSCERRRYAGVSHEMDKERSFVPRPEDPNLAALRASGMESSGRGRANVHHREGPAMESFADEDW